MRILVTNDDGIDATGLLVLAQTLRAHGDIVVAAPDKEYSGYGAALGPIHELKPDISRRHLDGIDTAWAISAPPALCVMFARLGVFGPVDLVVAGINPGANVGRSVYHSGTVGACLTARNGGLSGVAVSQSVANFGVEGQAWEDALANQQWQGAADIASVVVGTLVHDLPAEPVVANLNVPNCPAAEINGWRRTNVGSEPPRSVSGATLDPKPGHEGTFHVKMQWGDAIQIPDDDDGGAVMAGFASLTWLGRLEEAHPVPDSAATVETALDNAFGPSTV